MCDDVCQGRAWDWGRGEIKWNKTKYRALLPPKSSISSSQPPPAQQLKPAPFFCVSSAHPPCPRPALPNPKTQSSVKISWALHVWWPVRRNAGSGECGASPELEECWKRRQAQNPTPSELHSREALKTSLGPFRTYKKLIKKDGEGLFAQAADARTSGEQICALKDDVKLEESKRCQSQ